MLSTVAVLACGQCCQNGVVDVGTEKLFFGKGCSPGAAPRGAGRGSICTNESQWNENNGILRSHVLIGAQYRGVSSLSAL